ncbi:MAG: protein serine/threonine phosphatase, partial [Conexibacter sp.]|nr:protein serine/threonine phosphatase [Conexibacter sp.]
RRERRADRAQRAAAAAAAREVPGPKDRAHAPLPLKVKLLAATAATVVVLAILVFAGWLATRGVFFVGTNKDGLVTVYRGLPWELPGGLNLYEKYFVSGVPASEVPAARRKVLLNHQLRSRGDVRSLVADLELGKLSP